MSVDMTERFAFVYVLPFSFRYVVVQKIDYIFNKCFFHNPFNSWSYSQSSGTSFIESRASTSNFVSPSFSVSTPLAASSFILLTVEL